MEISKLIRIMTKGHGNLPYRRFFMSIGLLLLLLTSWPAFLGSGYVADKEGIAFQGLHVWKIAGLASGRVYFSVQRVAIQKSFYLHIIGEKVDVVSL